MTATHTFYDSFVAMPQNRALYAQSGVLGQLTLVINDVDGAPLGEFHLNWLDHGDNTQVASIDCQAGAWFALHVSGISALLATQDLSSSPEQARAILSSWGWVDITGDVTGPPMTPCNTCGGTGLADTTQ